jgi:hypothetical protein
LNCMATCGIRHTKTCNPESYANKGDKEIDVED